MQHKNEIRTSCLLMAALDGHWGAQEHKFKESTRVLALEGISQIVKPVLSFHKQYI